MSPEDLIRLSAPCGHAPRWAVLGRIAWVLGCGYACRGGPPCVGVAFAFGERREVPRDLRRLPETGWGRELRALFGASHPVGEATIRRCVLPEQLDAAREVGVDKWRRGVSVSGEIVAIGLSLGMPACVITPHAGGARRLAEGLSPARREGRVVLRHEAHPALPAEL